MSSNPKIANWQHMGKDWASRCILFILYSILRIVQSHIEERRGLLFLGKLDEATLSQAAVRQWWRVAASLMQGPQSLLEYMEPTQFFFRQLFCDPFSNPSVSFHNEKKTKTSLSGDSFGEGEVEWDELATVTQCRFGAGVPAHFSLYHSIACYGYLH